MIIEIKDKQFEMFDSGLWKILEEKGMIIKEKKEKRHWELKDDRGNIFQLLKGKEIYDFFGIEREKGKPSQVISPEYTIVKEEDKRITLILKRTQQTSGSTDQKLPYGDFMVREYKKILSTKEMDLDVDIAIITNDWFKEDKYSELTKYLKANGIKIWINQIKIF